MQNTSMRDSIKLMGWFHIVINALHLLVGVGCLFLFGVLGAAVASNGSADHAALPIFGAIGTFLFLFFAVISLPGMIVGWGLITFQPWARIGGIIISLLELPAFPLGTVLGVLGLYTLLKPEAVYVFENPQSRTSI